MASTRTRNGKFTGIYRDRAGRQRSAGTYGKKSEALRAARTAEALEASGRNARMALSEPEEIYAVAKRGHVTVSGYIGTFIAGARLEDTSRENYRGMTKRIERDLGNLPLRDLSPARVREFIRGLEADGKLASATVAHTLTVLRSMCQMAVIDGYLSTDPTAGVRVSVRPSRAMMIATPAQAKAIQAAIAEPYRLLVETMFASGARIGELMGLGPEHVQLRDTYAVLKIGRRVIVEVNARPVIRTYGKSARATRDVTIPRDLGERLIAHARNGYLFRTARGGYPARSTLWRVWTRACAAAGVPGLRIHDARHSHISWLANDPSVPLAAVRDRAGHASLATTSRYVHVMPSELDPCLVALGAAA